MKFYYCKQCGQIAVKLHESGFPLTCSKEEMQEMRPNVVDAAQEKHVPVIEINGREVKVKVGSVEHPMLDKHFIEFIVLVTKQGYQVKKPIGKPEASFTLAEGDEVVEAYEYCNLHGLWKYSK